MSLPKALGFIEKIWNTQHKHSAHVDSVLPLLGFSSLTGPAGRAIGALAQYGLSREAGSGENRTIAVSDLALSYLLADDDDAKAAAIRVAALKPPIYSQLWEKYGQFLPNDDTMQKYLMRERSFNPGVVPDVIADYRATFDFAKLGSSVPGEIKPPQNDQPNLPKPNDPDHSPTPPAAGGSKPLAPAPQQRTQPPMTDGLRYLPIPLGIGDAPIPVGMSEDDFELLLDTLKLWKRRIVKSEYPKQAIWKNKDTDMPVTITGVAGTHDGQLFYQSSTGTGIPASEIAFQ